MSSVEIPVVSMIVFLQKTIEEIIDSSSSDEDDFQDFGRNIYRLHNRPRQVNLLVKLSSIRSGSHAPSINTMKLWYLKEALAVC
jgi:hypothetical protein